jgi:hypothetical protein
LGITAIWYGSAAAVNEKPARTIARRSSFMGRVEQKLVPIADPASIKKLPREPSTGRIF